MNHEESADIILDANDEKFFTTPLIIIFITVFIDLLGFGIVLPLLPRYGKYFGADEVTLGLLMASFSAMQFVFAPLWGRLSDRIGRRPVLLLGLAGSTVSYAMFGFASSLGNDGSLLGLTAVPWFFITRIGAGIAGATIPTAQAYIADSTGPEGRAKGMALIGAAFGIGFTFGPLLGAMFVSDKSDGPPSPGVGFLAAGLSAAAFLWVRSREVASATYKILSRRLIRLLPRVWERIALKVSASKTPNSRRAMSAEA